MMRRLTGRSRLGRGFTLLFSGAVVSRFGDANRGIAIMLLAVVLTRDPRLVSLVVAMSFLPWLLFGFLAGALVDRVDRRRAFLVTDLGRAAVTGSLGVLLMTGALHFWMLPVAAFVMGALQTVSDSCFNALLPQVVASEQLPQANARLSAAQSGIGRFLGLPAGAALFALVHWLPFLIDATSFVVAAICVSIVRVRPLERAAGTAGVRGMLQDVREGLAALWTARRIRALVGTVAAMNLAAGATQTVLALFALYVIGMGSVGYGWLTATSAGAMIAGNLVAGRLQKQRDGLSVAILAVTLQVPGFVLIALARNPVVLFLGAGVTGFTAGMWNVPSMSVLMAETDRALMGRMVAAYKTIALCTAPAGAAVGGVMSSALGFRAVFALAAGLVAGGAAMLMIQQRAQSNARPAAMPAALTVEGR